MVKSEKISRDLSELVDNLSNLAIVDMIDLIKMIEEKWGVTAGAMIAGGASQAPAAAIAEQTEFTAYLINPGDKKIEVIKEVRVVTGLGLKEAKDFVESAPKSLKEGLSKSDAAALKAKFDSIGATVEIK